jgi:hypothetical protein
MKQTMKEKWSNFTHSRRFRYGSVALAFTAVVILLVIVANIAFTALASHFMWYADMTDENLYGVGDASITAVQSSGARYEILFCNEKDSFDSAENGLGGYVVQCAKQYERASNVSIRYLDPNNPDTNDKNAVAYYSIDGGRTKPSITSVIVAAYAAGAAEDARPVSFRILTIKSFFASDSETGEIFAFDGEYKFTVTMLGLTGEKPTVYFTDGHGETNGESTMLYQLFEDAGYEVRVIDLATDSLPADVDCGDMLMVVNNPQKDFGAFGSLRDPQNPAAAGDEVTKLDTFLSRGGNLILFADPIRYSLPKLQEVLELRGIGFETAGYVTDTANSLAGAAQGQTLVAQYPSNENNASHALVQSIASLKTITPNAVALKTVGSTVAKIEGSDDYQNVVSGEINNISPILMSSPSATVGGTANAYHLMMMVLTPRHKTGISDIASEAEKESLMLVCGSPDAVSDTYLGSTAYANRDLLYGLLLSVSSQNGSLALMPSEISMKTLSDETLTITTTQANVWTAICVAVLPVAAAVCGIVVYVRRKHL